MGRASNIIKRSLKALSENVSKSQLDKIEAAFDKLFAKVGINIEFTKHFIDRVNDSRNVPEISIEDLVEIFGDTYKKYGKEITKLGPDAEAVLRDIETDVNIPFVLVYNSRYKQFDMVSKTIMRKANFASSTPFLNV
jgi:hypothetical protein